MARSPTHIVTPGLDPGVYVAGQCVPSSKCDASGGAWIPGSSPGMTMGEGI